MNTKNYKKNIAGKLAESFIVHPLTLMLSVLILAMGYVTLQISPREANPQIVVAGGAVIVPYPGVKASEIQKVIIEPLQRRLQEVEGVENIFGIAQDNFAILTDRESQIYPLLSIREDIVEKLSEQYEVQKTDFLDFTLTDRKTNANFYLHWDGEQKLSMDTILDLGKALGVAIVLIFFMMVVYYINFSLASAIVLASFISVAGVIYIHLVFDIFTSETFYLAGTSLIGFIALIGINSRNSILIIDFAKQLIEEKHLSVEKAIAISVNTRAKPILLTVLAIIFASALLATDPVFGGLGVALIGGTLAAYAVSLFIVPIIIHGALLRQYPASGESYEKQ